MTRRWIRASQFALVLVIGMGAQAGCEPGSSGSTSSGGASSDSGSGSGSDTEAAIGWFALGWGEQDYVPLAPGDPFPIVRGGQGAEMFPMPLRGAEFFLPGNPTSWMDETGPMVDIEIDIEGYDEAPGGHFKRIANYTLDWIVLEDGTYQSSFLPIIVPDGVEADALEGETAHLWVRLRPYEQPALELEMDVVVTVMSE